MSQQLVNTFGEVCAISPKLILSICIAAHSRFAKAEEVASRQMHSEALSLLGDSNTVSALVSASMPAGPTGDEPLIRNCLILLKIGGSICNFLNKFVPP